MMARRTLNLMVVMALLVAARIVGGQVVAAPRLPSGIAYDVAGNLYFADVNRHQVYEATLGGALVVVAGSGVQGFAGDGGTATSAELDSPQGVAIGPDGTIYIADTGNQRVRAVVPSGQISTFAGNGVKGFLGDGGAAIAAEFRGPVAVAVDLSGALLICDSGNQRVRRVSGGQIATFAGSGVQGFSGDGGAAVAAQFDTPSGVAVGADGRVFVADEHNQRLRVIAVNGTISTFAGTGVAGYSGDGGAAIAAKLSLPRGVAVVGGDVVFADANNQRIRSVDSAGTISTLAGDGVQGASSDGSAATGAALNSPRGVGVSSFSSPVVADAANRMVRVLLTNGDLYLPAGMTSGRSSSVVLTAQASAIYGQASATITVSGSAATPQGNVQLLDGGVTVGQAMLSAGTATMNLTGLSGGAHLLTASYAGDVVNPAAVSKSSSITIGLVPTLVAEQVPAQGYAGMPIVLTASVQPGASGVGASPSGVVNFMSGSTVLATGSLAGGTSTATWLSPTAGTQPVVATYAGDSRFAASSSAAGSVVVAPMPDFALSLPSGSSQTVQGGLIATYTIAVTASPGPFTGAVSMSASGAPVGAVVSFSPPLVVPGSGSVIVTMSVLTPVLKVSVATKVVWLGLLMLVAVSKRRKRLAGALALLALVGCGNRTVSEAGAGNQTSTITVTGSSTNLAGAVVTHTAGVTLIIE